MAKNRERYWSWIGPYPYNPWLIFIFFASFYFSRFVPAINEQPQGWPRWVAGLTIILLATIPSGIFALLAFLFQRFRFWPLNVVTYVAEVAVGQAFVLLLSPLIGAVWQVSLGLDYSAVVILNPSLFLASLVLVLSILAIIHRVERATRTRLSAADILVAKLESDREGLVRADEALRDQTARFLHDRVQSDLMVAGMKLKNLSGKSPDEVKEIVDRVISRLEQTRTADLKDLVQILSPNFEAAGFRESVKVFAQTYRTSMKIDILVDNASENLNRDKLLGAFRIIEQALINALVHGPAKNVEISLETNEHGTSKLEISDDGPGGSIEQIESGVGTAVIDSWVGILNASKTIDTMPGSGYRLTVEFNS